METVLEALSHHRATRRLYMKMARCARDRVRLANRFIGHPEYGDGAVDEYAFHDGAKRCFVKHARVANRNLVRLKVAIRIFNLNQAFTSIAPWL